MIYSLLTVYLIFWVHLGNSKTTQILLSDRFIQLKKTSPPQLQTTPDFNQHSKFTIQNKIYQKYLKGDRNGSLSMAIIPSTWESWRLIKVGSKYRIKSHHPGNNYLRANPNGVVDLVSNPAAWQEWSIKPIAPELYIIVSAHSTFLKGTNQQSIVLSPVPYHQQQWRISEIIEKGQYFRIVSIHGTHLRADQEKNVNLVGHANIWQEWMIYPVGNKYVIRSHHGTYLRATIEGEVDLVQIPNLWQEWTIQKIKYSNRMYFALKSYHGNYLSGKPDRKVNVSPNLDRWEFWEFKLI